MRKYELLFIVSSEHDEEKVASIISRYKDVVTEGNGTVHSAEKWGKRRFAYEINDMREGLYILMVFEAEREVSAELDRLMKIDQDIVRHMIVRLDNVKRKQRSSKQSAKRPQEPRVEAHETRAVRVVREPQQGSGKGASSPEGAQVEQGELK
ncbi:MAG: 30S ribosomal protein S6 [Firmicutes bacterium]|jgi:small subunit ribosomal protein S6|nr:30S ribosomal protein S6 [Candidatus Fermentithermobacillaceae bacterium]